MRLPTTTTLISVLTLLALTACTVDPKADEASLKDGESPADQAAWLEKTSAALRNGEGLGPNDDVDSLLAMSREDVVKTFMADPRFGDTILSFNLFYLGRSVNQLKTVDQSAAPGTRSYKYASMVYAVPQALASARAVMDGGDYFELYSGKPSVYMAPMRAAAANDPVTGLPLTGTDAEKRAKMIADLTKSFDAAVAAMGEDGALNKQAGCSAFQNFSYQVQYQLNAAGFDERLGNQIGALWVNPIWAFPGGECYDPNVTGETVKKKLIAIRDGVKKLFEIGGALQAAGGTKYLSQLAKLDLAVDGLPSLSQPLTTEGFWSILRNSSTNHNRKRSAYMLRTYFCDDLTPLSIEAPADHAAGQHGSDPACMACHYKLDPMGGLFRYSGQNGQSFEGQKTLTFDDFKTIGDNDLAEYLKTWKDTTVEEEKWHVGYYVGVKKPHKKWVGNKLADLWTFLPQAPEVKQCLVRRMAEYFLGPDQVYDGAWLEEISASLKPGATSSAEVKNVVQRLVLSKTFSTQNPEPGKCYDFSADDEGGETVERAPCEIASVVKKRCATCHSDTENGVDFNKWIKIADGVYGFEHLDENGAQRSRNDSYKMIIERLTSTDPQVRMPKGGSMSEMERQVLYKWLEKITTAAP